VEKQSEKMEPVRMGRKNVTLEELGNYKRKVGVGGKGNLERRAEKSQRRWGEDKKVYTGGAVNERNEQEKKRSSK